MKVTAVVTGIPNAIAEVESKVHKTARVLVLEIWENLMDRHPVASGRSRANWDISETGTARELPPGQYGLPPTPSIPRFDELFIVNPIDYVQYLNEGWSQQAPALFIETSLADAVSSVRGRRRI